MSWPDAFTVVGVRWLNRCHIGDVREVLARMIADGVTVQMCVTSPPYWGLRDYGTASWEGGDPECTHDVKAWYQDNSRRDARNEIRNDDEGVYAHPSGWSGSRRAVSCSPGFFCRKCGARRIDAQIGLEPTPEEYVATMVEVFRLVREVLAEDGTLWLNLGDAYASGAVSHSAKERSDLPPGELASWASRDVTARPRTAVSGLKPKDLIGIPWRVAFALQADGWYLRSDIIWHKPNPMPESVTDRPTKAHEYLFLLSKMARYYYDAEAIRDPLVKGAAGSTFTDGKTGVNGQVRVSQKEREDNPAGRNRRTVWTIATEAYSDAHFATFPRKLVEPCILAGTSERGHCPGCGKRWMRVVERGLSGVNEQRPDNVLPGRTGKGLTRRRAGDPISTTTGWQPPCTCALDPVPDIVLDPFLGSGTVAEVAQHLGRQWIGIDLNPQYAPMQQTRTAQQGLRL